MVMTLTHRDAQRIERLFDQQMWSFGRDVQCDAGNLLVAFGFRRVPSVDPAVSSTYEVEQEGRRLSLSSVGVRCESAGEVAFLDRGPMVRQLHGCSARATAAMFEWFAEYEEWVGRRAGVAWRTAALAARTRPAAFAPDTVPAMWRVFASTLGAAGGYRRE